MTKEFFLSEISKMCARRSNRDELAEKVLNNEELYILLFELMGDINNKSSERAAWIFEIVSLKKTECLIKHKHLFVELLPIIKLDSVIRSVSKVCSVSTQQHITSEKPLFTSKELDRIINACFDWLIHPKLKVAPKVHAMQTLFNLRNEQQWISTELLQTLELNISEASAGYKSRAKKLILALKKEIAL